MEPVEYHKIQYLEAGSTILDGDLTIFEKIDGGNCQIRAFGERLATAARSGDGVSLRAHEWFEQFSKWAHRFYGTTRRELGVGLSDLLPERYVVFGEWTATKAVEGVAVHSIQYDPQFMNRFFLIDVYDLDGGRFLPYEQAVEVASADKQLPVTYGNEPFKTHDQYGRRINAPPPMIELPVLHRGPITYEGLDALASSSDFRDGPREGVVLKDYTNQRFAKHLHPDYAEKVRGGKDLESYLTFRRLEKIADRIIEDGTQPLNPTTLRHAFITDVRSEAKAGVELRIKDIERWLAANSRKVLRRKGAA